MEVKKYIRWVPAVIWMGVIFYLSAQPAAASSELSQGVMQVVVQVVGNVLPIDEGAFHQVIRKGAHLGAYFILAILLMGAIEGKNHKSVRQIGIVVVVCIGYAITDEVHQLFVPGRSGEVRDVVIDTVGGLIGTIVYLGAKKGLRVWRT